MESWKKIRKGAIQHMCVINRKCDLLPSRGRSDLHSIMSISVFSQSNSNYLFRGPVRFAGGYIFISCRSERAYLLNESQCSCLDASESTNFRSTTCHLGYLAQLYCRGCMCTKIATSGGQPERSFALMVS